jgi:hypothetical protein
VLKLGYFGKYFRNIWDVSKCVAGEAWRKSSELIVGKMMCYTASD